MAGADMAFVKRMHGIHRTIENSAGRGGSNTEKIWSFRKLNSDAGDNAQPKRSGRESV
jgi:hypothetical protein